jgi:TM2 domain-containing membrane protein YozV
LGSNEPDIHFEGKLPTMSNIHVNVEQKSVGTAYLLWLFLGFFGGHQFYLGNTGRAISYLFTFGWLTIGAWIDMFTMKSQVQKANERLYNEAQQLSARRQAEAGSTEA